MDKIVAKTIFRTYVDGRLVYEGESLESAARVWDAQTHDAGRSIPGGITVADHNADGVWLRDGWIMQVMLDGTVHLSPHIKA